MTSWAEWLVAALGIYAALGLAFALAFVTLGVQRIDPAARKAPWGLRAFILPGVVALWPMLALRWARARSQPPTETNAHRKAAGS